MHTPLDTLFNGLLVLTLVTLLGAGLLSDPDHVRAKPEKQNARLASLALVQRS